MNKPDNDNLLGSETPSPLAGNQPTPPGEKDSPRVIALLLVGMAVFFLLGVGMLYLVFRGSGRN